MAFLPAFSSLVGCGDTPHVHSANEHGFCSCGEYLGETKAFEEGSLTILQQDSLEDGASVFCRAPFDGAHLIYHIEEFDEWTDETILQQLSVFTIKDGEAVPYDIAVTYGNDKVIEIGDDGYVYFALHNKGKKVHTPFIRILSDHTYNEAGVCEKEGNYKGTDITYGSASVEFLNHEDDHEVKYYRYTETAPVYVGGHSMRLELTGIQAEDVKMYYVDSQFKAHHVTDEDGIPLGIDKLYLAYTHNHVVSNGTIRIWKNQHTATEHCFCTICETFTGGSELLAMNDEYTEKFTIDSGTTYYYHFSVKNPKTDEFEVQIDAIVDLLNHTSPNYKLYYWNGENFVLLTASEHSSNRVSYDVSIASFDFEYVLFEFTAPLNLNDVRIRVHDFE